MTAFPTGEPPLLPQGLLHDQYLPTLDNVNDDELGMMISIPFDDAELQWLSSRLTNNAPAPSQVAKSPAQSFHSWSEGACSLSPSTASQQIPTPSSSQLSPFIAVEEPESDFTTSSPESARSLGDDFVQLQPCHVGANIATMNRTSTSQAPQRADPPTTAPIQLQHDHAVSPPAGQQWDSFNSSVNAGITHDDTMHFNFDTSTDFELFGDDILNEVGGTSHLPFRHLNDGSYQAAQAYFSPTTSQRLHAPPLYTSRPYEDIHYTAPENLAMTQLLQSRQIQSQAAVIGPLMPVPSAPIQVPPTPAPRREAAMVSRPPRAPSSRSRLTVRTQPPATISVSPDGAATSASSFDPTPYMPCSSGSTLIYPAIRKAEPGRIVPLSLGSTPPDRVQKGGRKRGAHLHEVSRQRSHAMRKLGACWRCVMQRDPCDDRGEGLCCSRCEMRAQRGQTYFFDCDRSKLPEFVGDFLPAWLLVEYQLKYLEDLVEQEVVTWHYDNCIDVSLTCGYGPAFSWRLYEFTPRTENLMFQLQYFQDQQTGQQYKQRKYSPPYGMLRIDSSDDRNFETYLDALLSPHYLKTLGRCVYLEETSIDPGMFQCTLLDLLSKLYIDTTDATLKNLLRDILRMIVVTEVMKRTICITENAVTDVVGNIRHTRQPPIISSHTSPRLANRQFKFFFQAIRNSMYEKILKWQQHTLHTAGKKDQTWLPTFCVMLGLAIVLEEIERTVLMNADAIICREGEGAREGATAEAKKHIERIDARFKLLIGLFKCKYRDKKWSGNGSFGNGTPQYKDAAATTFLWSLRRLVEDREDYLRGREKIEFGLDHSPYFTTRLTARFLLPFLNLPPT